MLLYWRNARYTKYSYEAICRLNAVATSTPQLAHEVQWCQFVNTKGGLGNNIPVDLCMEHLNLIPEGLPTWPRGQCVRAHDCEDQQVTVNAKGTQWPL